MRVALAHSNDPALHQVASVLRAEPNLDLLWSATNRTEMLRLCLRDTPDVLLADLSMIQNGSVESMGRIMADSPCAVIVLTDDPDRDAGKVFAAMNGGALDVAVVAISADVGTDARRRSLLRKISSAGSLAPDLGRRGTSMEPATESLTLLAIGASAGGPGAVARLLADLPGDLPLAAGLVQHVDQQFASSMAKWLNAQTPLEVAIARNGEKPRAGRVYMAGAKDHLVLKRDGTFGYTGLPSSALYSPSINVLLESVARNWKGPSIGVILSGMGKDGAQGLLRMREGGARTIAQDRETSAVFGMPGAAMDLGAVTDVLPVSEMGAFIARLIREQAAVTQAVAR